MRAPYGYDPADYCRNCHASSYDTTTATCEDYEAEKIVRKEKAERRHAPTEAAWAKVRAVLTSEEWELLQLREKCGREYRVRDIIR